MAFVHLHMHTEYSLLDGANRISELVEKIKELGMNAVAITDHGNMFGVIEMYKKCKEAGIKPIIGCEMYMAPRSRLEKQGKIDAEPNHLILLAMNNTGYKNLIKLNSIAYTEGFYYKPRIDMEVLKKYSEGLICTSACLAGGLSRKILNSDYEGAKKLAIEFKNIFGKERYFLELQDNKLREQLLVNQKLIELANELDLGLVATNDCHYLTKADYEFHEVLLCVQTKKTIEDEDRLSFSTNEFYVKNEIEMRQAFKNIPSAIDNTQKIADMCNVEITFGELVLPEFKLDNGVSHLEYFTKLCYDNIEKKYSEAMLVKAKERLEYEINIINKMGFVDYFLIVADFVNYAKSKKISVGPGRGSGAGSIAAYIIGITDIDPLKFNLIFERFLNPERISMPDFDIDFCYERRQEVIDYVARKYGRDHVAQIITFGTMAARAAIRDIARALNVPYQKADMIAKLVPHDLKITIDKALKYNEKLYELYQTDPQVRKVIDYSKKAEGLPRHASTHAAGVVITKLPVNEYVPLYVNQNITSTQYTMTTLEELGLLKMDFLGLRTLTVISDCIKLVENGKKIKVDFGNLDDKLVYNMLSEGRTNGIFQLESRGITQVLKDLKPDSIEDIIVTLSLYRPGPMDQIPRYIKNKNNPDEIEYMHEALKPILQVTYGCIVYQEQVMQIFRNLAGYSLGRADLVRRAMSKKKIEVMNKEREVFVAGAGKNGISNDIANKIFDEMAEFAKYAFNKSHAACYAIISYQTAYLKRYYPHEFMAATMNSILGNIPKISEYIEECKSMNIEVLRPDINESYAKFTVINSKIRFALTSIKNVGDNSIDYIIAERQKFGNYTNFVDFCERVYGDSVNKRCVEGLIKAGCFDGLEKDVTRYDLLENYEKILDSIARTKTLGYENQINLFDLNPQVDQNNIKITKSNKVMNKKELLDMEKEVIGIYVSGHPLDEYSDYIKANSTITNKELNMINNYNSEEYNNNVSDEKLIKEHINYDGEPVKFCGIIIDKKVVTTRNGKRMTFIQLEDMYGILEVVIFASAYQKYESLLYKDNIIQVEGKISLKENEKPKILANVISPIVKQAKIYIKIPEGKMDLENIVIENIKQIVKIYPGINPIYLYYGGTDKLKLLNRDLWLNINSDSIQQLINKFGKDNIKIK